MAAVPRYEEQEEQLLFRNRAKHNSAWLYDLCATVYNTRLT